MRWMLLPVSGNWWRSGCRGCRGCVALNGAPSYRTPACRALAASCRARKMVLHGSADVQSPCATFAKGGFYVQATSPSPQVHACPRSGRDGRRAGCDAGLRQRLVAGAGRCVTGICIQAYSPRHAGRTLSAGHFCNACTHQQRRRFADGKLPGQSGRIGCTGIAATHTDQPDQP